MKKLFAIIALFLSISQVAQAAPPYTVSRTIVPEVNNLYELGSSTLSLIWKNIFSTNFLSPATANGCATWLSGLLTTTGSACGSGAPFTFTTNFGQVTAATTTPLWLQGSPYSLFASSTSIFNAVGVGGVVPNFATLEVQGTTTTAAGRAFAVWNSAGTNLFTINNAGNVGVGTTSPTDKLSVFGDNANVIVGSRTGGFTNGFLIQNGGVTNSQFTSNSSTGEIRIGAASTGSWFPTFYSSNSGTLAERMRIDTNGNMGIGTTSPSQALSVQGNGLFSGNITAANITATGTVSGTGLGIAGNGIITGNLSVGGSSGNTFINLNHGSQFYVQVQSGLFSIRNNSAAENILNINSTNVGIGTTSPFGKLSVTNTGTGPSLLVEDTTSPDTTPFVIDANGNVGIGMLVPLSKLDLLGGAAIGSYAGVTTAPTNGLIVSGNSGFGTSTPNATMYVFGSKGSNITSTATDLTIATSTTNYVRVTSTASARTITLPQCDGTTLGNEYTVKDASGLASVNNITIARVGTDLIDGATTNVMASNYLSRMYKCGAIGMWDVN